MGFIFGPTISAIIAQYGIFYPVYLCTALYLFDMYLLYSYFPDSTSETIEIEEDKPQILILSNDERLDDLIKEENNLEGESKINNDNNHNDGLKKMDIYSLCTDTSAFIRVILSSTVSYLLLVQFISSMVFTFLQ